VLYLGRRFIETIRGTRSAVWNSDQLGRLRGWWEKTSEGAGTMVAVPFCENGEQRVKHLADKDSAFKFCRALRRRGVEEIGRPMAVDEGDEESSPGITRRRSGHRPTYRGN